MSQTTPVSVTMKLVKMQHKWPTIARDLALMSQPQTQSSQFDIEDVARMYDLSLVELNELIINPTFRQLVVEAVRNLKALGPRAGFRMRAELLATELQEKLYNRAVSGSMEDKQMLQFLAVLLKSAGLEAPPEDTPPPMPAGPSVHVALNFPSIPGRSLDHARVIAKPQELIDV